MSKLADFENSIYLPFRHIDSAHYIDIYMRAGGYSTLYEAQVGENLSKAKIVTRNGQLLQNYWSRMVLAPTKSRAIVANLATTEPGMYVTKRLVSRNPHGLIEGILLAARATGSDHAVIVVPFNDKSFISTLERAIAEAKEEKLWGAQALWFCDIYLVPLPASSLYGQDDFLLAALHGQRPGHPNRMDFLFGEPVHIHRAEEFYAFSWIERFGADAFAQKGTLSTPGTYLVCISGNVPHPVVVEAPGGASLAKIMQLSGILPEQEEGQLRWGGVLGRWISWQQAKELPFELTHGPLKLKKFQYPVLEWFRDENVELVKSQIADYIAHESCGVCNACAMADTGLFKWSKQQRQTFSKLAKCSFLPLALEVTGGPAR